MFNWNLHYRRFPRRPEDKIYIDAPIPSPVMVPKIPWKIPFNNNFINLFHFLARRSAQLSPSIDNCSGTLVLTTTG